MNESDKTAAEEYTDEVLEVLESFFDPEWHGTQDYVAYVCKDVVAWVASEANIGGGAVNRDSIETMVRQRMAARST